MRQSSADRPGPNVGRAHQRHQLIKLSSQPIELRAAGPLVGSLALERGETFLQFGQRQQLFSYVRDLHQKAADFAGSGLYPSV